MDNSQNNNATRLLLPEYGRNVQKMVEFLKTIEDRNLRNRQAEVVVAIMANLYPYKRDTDEFRNMLWDHLFMIADFDLDIDSPYPKPTADQFAPKPHKIKYPQSDIPQKQYGKYAPEMVRKVANTDDDTPQDIEYVAINIAKFIRQKSYDYNNEYPDNQTVIADMIRMAGGKMDLTSDILDSSQVVHTRNNQQQQQQQQNNNNRRRNKRKK